MEKISIAHIINPVKVVPEHPSYLYYAQPITFRSMIDAKKYIDNNKQLQISVDLYTAQFKEDREIIPAEFIITSDLEYNIHNFVEFENKTKKLPRIKDIINKLYENSNAEYFIYTNADIVIDKMFYSKVAEIIRKGYDAICIHRCDVPKKIDGILITTDNYDKIYNIKGKDHPGHDCFVFKRNIAQKIDTGNVFIGYPPIGTVLKNQISLYSRKFQELNSCYRLTFHIGIDASWAPNGNINNEYKLKNKMLSNQIKRKEHTKKI